MELTKLKVEQLQALAAISEALAWKNYVATINARAANEKATLYSSSVDDTPVLLGKVAGRLEALEWVVRLPSAAQAELRRRKVDESIGLTP